MQPDPNYHAYLLRLWRSRDNAARWRASLEDVHTRERRAFADVADVLAFLGRLAAPEEREGDDPSSYPTDLGPASSGGTGLWMSMATFRTDPENVVRTVAILEECCGAILEDLRSLESYYVHSAGDPGTIVLVAVWESQEHQEAAVTGNRYVQLVRERLAPLLVAPPRREGLHIIAHSVCKVGGHP